MSGQSTAVLKVGDELNAALDLRRQIAAEDDPALIADMIEGSTNLPEAIAALYEEIVEAEAMEAGLDAKIKDMSARKSRLATKSETLRNIILMALDRSGLQTVRTPLATLTVRATDPKPVIEDEALIPAQFWKRADPTLNKAALNAAAKAAAKAGEKIPGVAMSNGGISLTIRKV